MMQKKACSIIISCLLLHNALYLALTVVPLYIGAGKFSVNGTYKWISKYLLNATFASEKKKMDNVPDVGLNCILVYLKPDGLHYKYAGCADSHYYMCSTVPGGKNIMFLFFSALKIFYRYCIR